MSVHPFFLQDDIIIRTLNSNILYIDFDFVISKSSKKSGFQFKSVSVVKVIAFKCFVFSLFTFRIVLVDFFSNTQTKYKVKKASTIVKAFTLSDPGKSLDLLVLQIRNRSFAFLQNTSLLSLYISLSVFQTLRQSIK